MSADSPAYGLWLLVMINAAVFILFAFSFSRPRPRRDWRSFGAFSGHGAELRPVQPEEMIMARTASRTLAALFLAASLAVALPAAADDSYLEAEGLAVYLGVVPAAIVRGSPPRHVEERMHGGPPPGRHVHHLIVAVFDAATGERREDLRIEAEVAGVGLAGRRTPLEPMAIADTVTYGNYFDLGGRGLYRIRLWIQPPERLEPVVVEFRYDHPLR